MARADQGGRECLLETGSETGIDSSGVGDTEEECKQERLKWRETAKETE